MKGGAAQTLEQNLARQPFVGPAIRARQNEAMTAWNKNLMNKAAPQGEVTQAGQEGMRQLTQQFEAAYGTLWNQPIRLKSGMTVHGTSVREVQDQLKREERWARRAGKFKLADHLRAQREAGHGELPDDFAKELARLDKLYADFTALRAAGGYVSGGARGQPFTPAQLVAGSKAVDRSKGKGETARGQAPMQQRAQAAADVLLPSTGNPASVLERTVLAVPGAVARPFYSRPMQSWMRGDTALQRGVSDIYDNSPRTRALINALRQKVRAGQLGAAYEE
jgi:hypothetical protein